MFLIFRQGFNLQEKAKNIFIYSKVYIYMLLKEAMDFLLDSDFIYKIYVNVENSNLQGYLIYPRRGTRPKTLMVAVRHPENFLKQSMVNHYRLGIVTAVPAEVVKVNHIMVFKDNYDRILGFRKAFPEVKITSVNIP